MFWRQGLLVASILAYAVACIVIVTFASEPVALPGPALAGTGIADKVQGPWNNDLITQVKATSPIRSAQSKPSR